MTAQIVADYADVDDDHAPGPTGFQKFKVAGGRGVIVQAVYGRPFGGQSPVYRDKCWERDKEDIAQAQLVRGAYLFVCVPKPGVNTPEPEVQADAFADYVQLRPFVDMCPWFDVEERGTLSPEDYYKWILRVAVRLRNRFGIWPGMYTSNNDWIELLANHPPGPLLNCPLWLAKPWPYAEGTPVHLDGLPGLSPTLIPQFGNAWALYQNQGDAILCPGFSTTVDISRVRIYGRGSTGQQVVWTQKRLAITADGIFGAQTEMTLKMLQARYLPNQADGIVGIATLPLLMWSNPAPTVTVN